MQLPNSVDDRDAAGTEAAAGSIVMYRWLERH